MLILTDLVCSHQFQGRCRKTARDMNVFLCGGHHVVLNLLKQIALIFQVLKITISANRTT